MHGLVLLPGQFITLKWKLWYAGLGRQSLVTARTHFDDIACEFRLRQFNNNQFTHTMSNCLIFLFGYTICTWKNPHANETRNANDCMQFSTGLKSKRLRTQNPYTPKILYLQIFICDAFIQIIQFNWIAELNHSSYLFDIRMTHLTTTLTHRVFIVELVFEICIQTAGQLICIFIRKVESVSIGFNPSEMDCSVSTEPGVNQFKDELCDKTSATVGGSIVCFLWICLSNILRIQHTNGNEYDDNNNMRVVPFAPRFTVNVVIVEFPTRKR